MNLFNKNYYENGIESGVSLYSNYRWIPDLTYPLAFRIIEILRIKKYHSILDFGCAKGFLVKAFRGLYRNCYGVDISEYAIENCGLDIKNFIVKINSSDDLKKLPFNIKRFNFLLAKDVLEHVPYNDIDNTLKNIQKLSDCSFFIIPLGDGEKYYIKSYEFDNTHIIRENEKWWTDKIKQSGYKNVLFYNKISGIKDNWNCHPKGNGFFIAHNENEININTDNL